MTVTFTLIGLGLLGIGLTERAQRAWCKRFHRDTMWPMHGQYRCRVCHRMHELDWR